MKLHLPDSIQNVSQTEFECLLSAEGIVLSLSPELSSQLGYQAGELPGKQFTQYLQQDNIYDIASCLHNNTLGLRDRSGTYRLFEVAHNAIRDEAGKLHAYRLKLKNKTAEDNPAREASLAHCKQSLRPANKRLSAPLSEPYENICGDLKLFSQYRDLQNFKTALNAFSIIAITDAKGIIRYANDNFCRISQYNKGELLGKTHRHLNSGHHPAPFFQHMWQTISRGNIWRDEICNRAKDGSLYWVNTTIIPFLNEKGRPVQYMAIRQDITERKATEEAFLLKEQMYRSLFENHPDTVFITDSQARILSVNKSTLDIETGLPNRELPGKNFLDFLSDEDRSRISSALPDLLMGKSRQLETRLGNILIPADVLLTLVPIKERGTITGFYIMVRNISEKKAQFEELERIKIALENTSDAIGIGKSMGDCIYTNKAFEKILGWNIESINKKGGLMSILADPEINLTIYDSLLRKGHWEGKLDVRTIMGELKAFHLKIDAVLNEDGSLRYIIALFADLSEQLQAHDEIIKLSKAVEESSNEVYIFDTYSHKFSYINSRGLENLGYSMEEGKQLTPIDISPDFTAASLSELVRPLLRGQQKGLQLKTLHHRKDGSTYPVEIHLSVFQHGRFRSFMAQVIDITERTKTEEALRISNERYQLVTQATNDAIWDWDLLTQKVFWGEGYYSLFGLKLNEKEGMESWKNHIHPDDAKLAIDAIADVLYSGKRHWVNEYRFKCADGTYKYVRDRAYVIYDASGQPIRVAGAMTDITEQRRNDELLREFNNELEVKVTERTSRMEKAIRRMKEEVLARVQTEEFLQQSLKEKEILLKEIHHRVKNNMAIVSGLLSLQARQAGQQEVKAMFKESQSRIKTMALVHEHLYQHRNLASINFKDYIQELAEGIQLSFPQRNCEIEIQLAVEAVELDIVYAVPCGLILNELITNSYKYAFNDRTRGCIRVAFSSCENTFTLTVADNGVGMDSSQLPTQSKSLGMLLVQSLVKQIGGHFEKNCKDGTEFKIVFSTKQV